jgi:hypothetical protein
MHLLAASSTASSTIRRPPSPSWRRNRHAQRNSVPFALRYALQDRCGISKITIHAAAERRGPIHDRLGDVPWQRGCLIPQLIQRYGAPLLCRPSGKITYAPLAWMSTPGSQPRTLGITKPGGVE